MSEADKRAVSVLSERGVTVTIATGRLYSGTDGIARDLGVTGPVSCIDGAQIVDAVTGRPLRELYLPARARQRVARSIEEHAPITFLLLRDRVVHDRRGIPFQRFVSNWSQRLECRESLADPALFAPGEALIAIVCVGQEEQMRAVLADVANGDEPELDAFPFSFPAEGAIWHGLFARAARADKGSAVRWLAQHHGVDLAEIAVVGDWLNDLSMFQVAGRAFAMPGSPPQLVEIATDRVEAIPADGGVVAQVARILGLL